MKKEFTKLNIWQKIIVVIGFLIPLVICLTSIFNGSFAFWYDPARDFSLALDNLHKLSLIGPPSGIPGIFYGPYWIWLLSLALSISHDPRIVVFIILAIPYFTIFPYLLLKLPSSFGIIAGSLWFLFVLAFKNYPVQIWNPNLAPLFFLMLIYFFVSADYNKKNRREYIKVLLAGFAAGLLMNFHISFGLCAVIGGLLFLLINNNRKITLPLFVLGLLIIFTPFFIFELRHGFNQIQTIVRTITSSSAVVREKSNIDKLQIIAQFFNRFSMLLEVPSIISNTLLVLGVLYAGYSYIKNKIDLDAFDKKLLLLILTISVATLSVYLLSKNPIWDYHFIGVEVLFLLLLGLFAKKIKYIKYGLFVWIGVIAIMQIISFKKELSANPYAISSLATKEHLVNIIYDDANSKSFSVYTYSPAHFTPDFDYLLIWTGEKRKSNQLKDNGKGDYVYLIIPWTTKDLKADFIDNRTPHKKFRTVKTWHIADETTIVKRIRYETN